MVQLNLAKKSGLQEGEDTLFSSVPEADESSESIEEVKESLFSAAETEHEHHLAEDETERDVDYEEEPEEEVIPRHWSRVPEEKSGSKLWVYIPLIIILGLGGYYIVTKYMPQILGSKKSELATTEQETPATNIPSQEQQKTQLPQLTDPYAVRSVKDGIALMDIGYRILSVLPETVYLENLSLSSGKFLVSFYSFGVQENRFFRFDLSRNLGFEKPDKSLLVDAHNVAGANFKSVFSYSLEISPATVNRTFYSMGATELEGYFRSLFANSSITPSPVVFSQTDNSATIQFNAGLSDLKTFLTGLANHQANFSLNSLTIQSGLNAPLSDAMLTVHLMLTIL